MSRSLGAGWFDGYNFLTFEGQGCDRAKAEAVAKADLREFAYKIKTEPAYGVDFYFRKFVTQWSTPMYQGLAMNNCLEAERPRLAESVYFGRSADGDRPVDELVPAGTLWWSSGSAS